jgi:ABC-type uncharacterized transport system ATPase component
MLYAVKRLALGICLIVMVVEGTLALDGTDVTRWPDLKRGSDAANLGDRLVMMMHRRQVLYDFSGADKSRLRADDLLNRFEDLRRAEQPDESAADMLRRLYV